MAFTQNTVPTFSKQPMRSAGQLTNPGTTDVTVYTAGSNGSKIIGLIAASTDTSSQNVQLAIQNGGTDYPLGNKAVPAGAGLNAGTIAVNLLDPTVIVGMPVDSDGNPFLYMVSGDTLVIKSGGTITSGKTLTVNALGADF